MMDKNPDQLHSYRMVMWRCAKRIASLMHQFLDRFFDRFYMHRYDIVSRDVLAPPNRAYSLLRFE